MRINSEDKQSFVELTVEDAYCSPTQTGESDDNWDMKVSLHLWTEGLMARLYDVSLYRSFVEPFLVSLRELNSRRRGIAKLEGLGYERMELTIYNSDQLGHLGVSVAMERYDLELERQAMKATANFNLDPSDLPGVLYDFEQAFSRQNLAREFSG
jgi:hypothetical protein